MTARSIGEAIFRSHWRPGRRWLCVFALVPALWLAGSVRCRAAQPGQSGQDGQAQPSGKPDSQAGRQADSGEASSGQAGSGANSKAGSQTGSASASRSNSSNAPSQSGVDSAGSTPAAIDPAAELLEEFPADSPVKADNDPRDGHLPSEPAAKPLPPEEKKPPEAVVAVPARAALPSAAPVAATIAPHPPKAPVLELPTDPHQRQVAIECSDLLKMATDLKAAVDKSTKDELSVDVVRKAGELEQYARKVREGTKLTAGTQ